MRAGPLRHRCRLLKVVRAQNSTGGFDEVWVEVAEVFAEVTLPTGRIMPVAEQLKAVVTAEVRLHPRADVAAGWRLVRKRTGQTYKIEAALLNNEGDMLRLLCSSVSNP